MHTEAMPVFSVSSCLREKPGRAMTTVKLFYRDRYDLGFDCRNCAVLVSAYVWLHAPERVVSSGTYQAEVVDLVLLDYMWDKSQGWPGDLDFDDLPDAVLTI